MKAALLISIDGHHSQNTCLYFKIIIQPWEMNWWSSSLEREIVEGLRVKWSGYNEMFLILEHTISGSKRKINKQKRNEISYDTSHICSKVKVKFIDVIDHFYKN
jgi:hypothetical protein